MTGGREASLPIKVIALSYNWIIARCRVATERYMLIGDYTVCIIKVRYKVIYTYNVQ